MKKLTIKIGDVLFGVFIVLLIIPQTRTPIMVMVNRLKVELFSPGVVSEKEQIQLDSFIYEVENLEGESVHTVVGDGNITFISYWATWCPPCIAELPSIDALYGGYGDKIDFLMISDEHPEKIKLFLEKRNFSVPAVVSKMNPPKDLYEKTIPTNYIIDHTGKIVVKEKGASNWNSKKVRNLMDALIAEREASAK
ncbi:TlpA family protein disulfide reductase [Maribacter flavus]|uniref:TlpA family protein disulfide reductase n=1 Tax=Maribacter flavus TaxID=1658664 RepID=A0A5B2TYN1_9FLAO|nr:TlpA disulfide reductase family protein [Maribacter flavus]KAA2219467.1 TlpA family protein disulfide reductase [Maribacter flavus]